MEIYYLFIEGKPNIKNIEDNDMAGGYINCWVKAKDKTHAVESAVKYILDQQWELIDIEEIYVVQRDKYLEDPNSLECYDQAKQSGLGAIFYTWSEDEDYQ